MKWSSIVAILGLVIVAECDEQTAIRLAKFARKKPLCPLPDLIQRRLRPRPTRANRILGSCEVVGDPADRRDTCKYRMSCCENAYGDMLCVRARKFKFEETPLPPPPPPFKEIIPMLEDAVDPCPTECDTSTTQGYDHWQDAMEAGQCTGGCSSSDRTCCLDHCTPPPADGGPRLHLCFRNNATATPPPPQVPAGEQQDFTSDRGNDGVTVYRGCPAPSDLDGTGLCEDEVKYNLTNPVCQQDSDCITDGIEEGSIICCFDPCKHNTDTFRCYTNTLFNITPPEDKISQPDTFQVPVDAPPPVQISVQFDDAVELPAAADELVCPAADLSEGAPCIGWKGDLCNKVGGSCKDGKLCCNLSAKHCNDLHNYCVDGVKNNTMNGCPIPRYSNHPDAQWAGSCPKGCPDGKICCQLNSEHKSGKGQKPIPSHGCITPTKI